MVKKSGLKVSENGWKLVENWPKIGQKSVFTIF